MKPIVLAVLILLVSQSGVAQKADSQQVARPGGTFTFADGGGSMPMSEHLVCGPATLAGQANPGGGPRGPNHVELSFGILPSGDRLGDTGGVTGSWVVRSTAGPLYHGGVSRGTVTPAKGGVMLYELYGFTNFTGSSCNGFDRGAPGADYDTRNPVRIFGACGTDQEITVEISRRPLTTDKNGFTSFDESGVIARATFRGNVACGQTSDRSRVRTSLTSR
jgi:hypothetical protein